MDRQRLRGFFGRSGFNVSIPFRILPVHLSAPFPPSCSPPSPARARPHAPSALRQGFSAKQADGRHLGQRYRRAHLSPEPCAVPPQGGTPTAHGAGAEKRTARGERGWARLNGTRGGRGLRRRATRGHCAAPAQRSAGWGASRHTPPRPCGTVLDPAFSCPAFVAPESPGFEARRIMRPHALRPFAHASRAALGRKAAFARRDAPLCGLAPLHATTPRGRPWPRPAAPTMAAHLGCSFFSAAVFGSRGQKEGQQGISLLPPKLSVSPPNVSRASRRRRCALRALP